MKGVDLVSHVFSHLPAGCCQVLLLLPQLSGKGLLALHLLSHRGLEGTAGIQKLLCCLRQLSAGFCIGHLGLAGRSHGIPQTGKAGSHGVFQCFHHLGHDPLHATGLLLGISL